MSVVVKSRVPLRLLKSIKEMSEEYGVSRSEAIRMLVSLGLKNWMREKIDRAIGLYVHEQVSLVKAAELAGLPSDVLYDIVAGRGIERPHDELYKAKTP